MSKDFVFSDANLSPRQNSVTHGPDCVDWKQTFD